MLARRSIQALTKGFVPVNLTPVAGIRVARTTFSTAPRRRENASMVAEPAPASISAADTGLSSIVETLQHPPLLSKKVTPTLDRFTLSDKIAVVTGGARGLGFNIAEAFCDVDLKALVILDVLKEHGDEASESLSKQFGIPVVFKQIDVRNHRSVQGAVDEITNEFGRIDILVNSAGIADSNIPAEGYDVEKFRRLIDINLTGTFVTAQAVGNAMIKHGSGGSMIFIASMSGHIVNYPQQQSCYNASKAGVIMLGKSLAAEWAQHNIRVNMISPGYMDTALNRVPALDAQKTIWKERTPMGRLGDVNELNNLAVFLASDASSYMTGSDLLCDGGYCTW